MTPRADETTSKHRIVSHDEWLAARSAHLDQEKEFTRLRDELARQRRELPWEAVDKQYFFEGPDGRQSLADVFGSCSQLIVYHFMFAPEWQAGCPSCSFWADNFNGIDVHLRHRDTGFVAISRAPFAQLAAYKERMGWTFRWLSSAGSDFNYDYFASFTPEEVAGGGYFNYRKTKPWGSDVVGMSVFSKDAADRVFHTYSCYSRGVDMMNGAYHYLDLTPKGRDEDGQGPNPQAWVRRHDEYRD
jgi:predicted dithiol-disulfide oxidoreductase (DUF899 family)